MRGAGEIRVPAVDVDRVDKDACKLIAVAAAVIRELGLADAER